MSRMEEKADQALLVRAEEAAEAARAHAKAGRRVLALTRAAESVDLMQRARVDIAAWVKADRREMLR